MNNEQNKNNAEFNNMSRQTANIERMLKELNSVGNSDNAKDISEVLESVSAMLSSLNNSENNGAVPSDKQVELKSKKTQFFTESAESEEERPLNYSEFYPNDADEDNVKSVSDNIGGFVSDKNFAKEDVRVFDANKNKYEMAEEFDDATREFTADDMKQVLSSGVDGTREFTAEDVRQVNAYIDETAVFNANAVKRANRDFKEQNDDNVNKPNWFIRFLKSFIPWKGDKGREIARKCVFLVAFITLLAMLFQLVNYYFIEPFNNDNINNQLRSKYSATDAEYHGAEINPRFLALYKVNPDLVGWINVDGTTVNYPIVQGEKNSEYERADFYHKYNRFGSIFLDSSIKIDYGAESKNLVVYGHNMRDDKSMFSQLTRYRDVEHYKKYPTFSMDTLYNDGTWKIFSVMTTNAYAAQDNGQYFDYRRNDFPNDQAFLDWIEECKLRSCINTSVDVLPTDIIATLQTCVYEFSNARLVIMARRTRIGEDKNVDVSTASINNNAKYPQAWYDAKKLQNPYKDGVLNTSIAAQNAAVMATVESTIAPTTRTEQVVQKVTNSSGNVVRTVIKTVIITQKVEVAPPTNAAKKPSKPKSTTKKPAATDKPSDDDETKAPDSTVDDDEPTTDETESPDNTEGNSGADDTTSSGDSSGGDSSGDSSGGDSSDDSGSDDSSSDDSSDEAKESSDEKSDE